MVYKYKHNSAVLPNANIIYYSPRPFIYINTALQVYQALIEPQFDYCSSVWDGLNESLSNKLQKLQNPAARVITRSNYDASAGYLLENLHWDCLSVRRKKLKACNSNV